MRAMIKKLQSFLQLVLYILAVCGIICCCYVIYDASCHILKSEQPYLIVVIVLLVILPLIGLVMFLKDVFNSIVGKANSMIKNRKI